jgi:hypothetical protein
MPIELRNIKGGGLHYVAYKEFKTAISSQLRRSFSEQVLSTTLPTTSAWSRDQEILPIRAITTISTTKE